MSKPEEPRISLNEIARQMRQQREAEQDAQAQMARDLREEHPQLPEPRSTRAPAPAQAPTRTGLRALAVALRLQAAAVVLFLLSLFGSAFFPDPAPRAYEQGMHITQYAMLGCYLLSGLASWWLAFRLFRWIGGILYLALGFFLVFAPAGMIPMGGRTILAVLTFLVLNGIASNALKKTGAKVRFWGASPAQFPE